ncbi:iron ABC transporter permease [Paenibacillus sp. N1-5-1-14]|uniref:FecCD family ABC transporter permease n=1 Tax=Paenibacillus radicibacter TaxID=2972488 RepID=UPI002158B6E0|nr:iron ABC transporter permease [Paenibacillus radicibacter]MCR8644354.1 iron ABC transporter permease [Paenibacillus radicibacter]
MQQTSSIVSSDQRRTRRGIKVMAALSLLVLAVFIMSMNTGFIRLSPLEVIQTLFGMGTDKQELILFDFRLPRIVISILVGAGLAVSGCILQGISRNALADPGILGINAGAGLMVMLFVAFFPSTASAPVYIIPLLAFVGALLTAILIYVLAYKKDEGISPIRLLFNGIAIAAGISALMIVLTLTIDPTKYQFVATWLAGSMWGTNWKYVLSLLPWVAILIPFAIYKARVMNVLNLGDQMASGLGTPIEKERMMLIAVAVGLAGSCVAFSGAIGFVGLIGPHLASRLVGPKHQLLIPTSALVGSLLMIAADTIGRVILQPSEIPTGIIVAIIGAPYFLYLLAKSRG